MGRLALDFRLSVDLLTEENTCIFCNQWVNQSAVHMLAIPNKATTQGCLSSFKTPYIWREMVQVSYSVGVMFSSGKRMLKPLFMFGGKLKSGKCCLNLWVVSNIPNWEGNGISTDGQLWSRGDRWLKDIRFKWCNPQRKTGKGWQQQMRSEVLCSLHT